jgi:hypothetical protein
MEPQAAADITSRGAQRLTAALENPQEAEAYRLSGLCDALIALGQKIEPGAATDIANGLAAALKNLEETEPYRFLRFCDALIALGKKIEPGAATDIANWPCRGPEQSPGCRLRTACEPW